jgi:4-amino-4-deoxy-L-arabinose transferase-like glycosyltransferase
MDSQDHPSSLRPDRAAWILIGGLTLLLCWNLGRVELSVTDEARSAVIVRDMVEGGRWLLPRTPDGYLCEKPPVYYGSAAALGSAFGITEWTLRIVSVFFGAGTLILTWFLARLYASPWASRVAVVALASNLFFLGCARDATVDMALTFFLTAGFTAYFAARNRRLPPWKAALLCGAAFGLAVLSKGISLLAVPIAVVGGDALLEHRGRFWRALPWWKQGLAAFLLALGVSALWYVAGYLRGGFEFWDTCVLSENFRMPAGDAQGIGVSHRKSPLYYFGIQLAAVLPMLPLLPALIGWAKDERSGAARRNLGAWAGFGFLLFEVAANKRMYYLTPLQPAIAVMIALGVERATVPGREKVLRASGIVAGALVMLAGGAINLAGISPGLLKGIREGTVTEAVRHHAGWMAIGVFVMICGLQLLRATKPESIRRWGCALAVLVVAFRVGVGDRLEAEFNRTKPFVAAAAPQVPAGSAAVILPPIRGYSIDFYWPTRIVRDETLARSSRYLLAPRGKLDAIPAPYETVATWKYGPNGRDDVLLIRREQAR